MFLAAHLDDYMKMDFTCIELGVKDLISCGFGLSEGDYAVFNELLKIKKEITVNDLGKKMKKDRTTIQKSIKKLHEKDLIIRFQHNLKKGGYIYTYKIKEKNKIKQDLKTMFKSWTKLVEQHITDW